MEVGVSRSRPETTLVGDVNEHDAVIGKATSNAAQTISWVIKVLQDSCQQHHVVLGMSIEASSFLDWGYLHPKLRVGRSESRSHLYTCDIPSFLPCAEKELAPTTTELEHPSLASQSFRRFPCKGAA